MKQVHTVELTLPPEAKPGTHSDKMKLPFLFSFLLLAFASFNKHQDSKSVTEVTHRLSSAPFKEAWKRVSAPS